MTSTRLLAAVAIATLVFAACSSGTDSSGAAAAAAEFQRQHETKIVTLFGRPELRGYLMLPESFIGGTFPRGTAVLLREPEFLRRY